MKEQFGLNEFDVLRECRKRFKSAPRKFSWWNRLTCFRLSKPDWLKEDHDDELNELFDNMQLVYEQGVVVWGVVVQANSLLMEVGYDNAPGEVIFTLDHDGAVGSEALEEFAMMLGFAKMMPNDDPELSPVVQHLENELTRLYGYPIPKSFCPDFDLKLSTTFFFRKHLPLEVLNHHFLPLVVLPKPPYYALPLPEKFWPVQFWMEWSKEKKAED